MSSASRFPRAEIESILAAALRNEYSSFYRERLPSPEKLFPLTEEKWSSIPLLVREDITSTPFWERVFVAREDLPFIRNTYGTSGKRILVSPRAVLGDFSAFYGKTTMRRLMSFHASAHFDFPRMHVGRPMVSLFGDVGNLEISAKLARRARIDSLYILPYTALIFAEYLKREGVTDAIRNVQLCGERCSPLQFEEIKKLYPNAAVYGYYGHSESRELVGAPCYHDYARGSLTLESADEVFIEILDVDSRAPVTGDLTPGEIVLTTLTPGAPFPLIRYATGDLGQFIRRRCECERTKPGFEVLGRVSVFPVRLLRGELTVDAVEKAMSTIPGLRRDYFEIHYSEERGGGRVLPRIIISLVGDGDSADGEGIARRIENALEVFPSYTYSQGVLDGIYFPIEVSFMQNPPASPPGKPRAPVIVRHVAGSSRERPYRGSVAGSRDRR